MKETLCGVREIYYKLPPSPVWREDFCFRKKTFRRRNGRFKKGARIVIRYKVEFDKLEWESPIEGMRHKYIDQNGLRIRLVEYSAKMPPHWCEKGHYGYLIEGQMEIEFENSKIIYNTGDGIFIPDGPDHRHRGKQLSEKVLVFFVEKI